MAASYCLIGVLVLAVIVSGQEVGSKPRNDFLCPICYKTVGLLRNFTSSPLALAEAEKIAKLFCEFAPEEFSNECFAFAKEVPGFLKQFAEMYLVPKIDCMAFCPANEVTAKVGKMGNNGFSCAVCENIVGFMKNVTLNVELLANLETLLEDYCVLSPHIYYQNCLDLVKEIPHLVKLFAEEYLDPAKDCADVCVAHPALIAQKDAPATMKLFKLFESRIRRKPGKSRIRRKPARPGNQRDRETFAF